MALRIVDARGPNQKKFDEFHAANPHIYNALELMVEEAVASGASRIGMELLINRVRWDPSIRTGDKPYKVNQKFTSRYTRLIIANHPEWDNYFEKRKSAMELWTS